MSKFSAADAVDTLDFDFTGFLPADHPQQTGTIPEPSDKQIEAFRSVLAALMPTKTDASGKPTLDVETLSAKFESGEVSEDMLTEGLAAFCSNQPSADTISALPYRVQRAFIGWLVGTFFRPEASAPATTN